ncbi:hypothetical protein XCR1_840146 [Xenorhabdus cabanillasii JM26]|uniref:Uncharacterized protein n=1 Tax=Xenorhabdus cabanillasii JM26 TaxID=1427517 RepID=W1JB95_9GAMM|nr:hypothetical protein XCR1_840146 [Xenorhabdus cabanillasii JM26]
MATSSAKRSASSWSKSIRTSRMPFRFVPTRQNTRAELLEVFFETVVSVIMVYFSIVGIMVGIAASTPIR